MIDRLDTKLIKSAVKRKDLSAKEIEDAVKGAMVFHPESNKASNIKFTYHIDTQLLKESLGFSRKKEKTVKPETRTTKWVEYIQSEKAKEQENITETIL